MTDTMQEIKATADTKSTDATTTGAQSHSDHEHPMPIENKPASSATLPGSTVVDHPHESDPLPTQASNTESTVTPANTIAHDKPPTTGNTHPEEALVHPTLIVSPSPSGGCPTESVRLTIASTVATSTGSQTPKNRPTTTTASPQPERHILSYEQWRKQVLEKKNKPAEVPERKQRKRKPYQENTVDVAIGGEEEIGFVFPNLDHGNSKGADERAQLVGDQLGNGPDLKLAAGRDKEWIKSEYAKDPKDRFNHASATCAASVVKAGKDATSITAILNEGKDNYMLNKCSTKEKFFVVELCEEILVDTFILGNYEFFSSTFKDFVVSVNRYPPRDDGWSILGQFQARNTRDAQVFKPSVPQLATYIRFDFVNHYGNEYYCPVTLLRVYGATALEQLKQEEEEEKRLAEEEKRRAELEKAKQAVMETEDDDDDDESEEPEFIEEGKNATTETVKDHTITPLDQTESIRSDNPSPAKPVETQQGSEGSNAPSGLPETNPTQPILEGEPSLPPQDTWDTEYKGSGEMHPDPQPNSEHSTTGQPTFVLPEWPTEDFDEDLFKDDPSAQHSSGSPDSTLNSFGETMTATGDQPPTDILLPFPSTTPASMQDDDDWSNGDLGMITLSPKNKPSHIPKHQSSPKASSAGLGTPGGHSSATDSSAHPQPTLHSSQESVYKNIVNRLKALELNSSLSYQYLEEQSNVFNEVLESSEQKINQLVIHLNEAHRRLETLGRKYDQLAFSYRSHVEVDGEKRRQEFISLSSQVHVLGTQLVFQRQLFVVGAITLFSVIAFIAITRSSSMQYAIHQSPLGVKLRAMSRHKGSLRSNDISSAVRIGSVEGLSQFDQSTLRVPHIDDRTRSADEDCHMTPPISPMTPLTPDPSQADTGRMPDLHPLSGTESHHPDISSVHPNEEASPSMFAGDNRLPLSRAYSRSDTTDRHIESPDSRPSHLNMDRFLVSQTPYPTPKSSHGSGRIPLHPNHSHSTANTMSFPIDYRPDSPVFQGPSSGQDDGQLSDADVAYMSRDMNVGRVNSSSSGSLPTTPATKRLSISYYNQFHHSTNRPSSSLRMDTTASLTASDRTQPSPNQENSTDANNTSLFDVAFQEGALQEGAQANNTHTDDKAAVSPKSKDRAPDPRKELDDDVGFVSDSALDSVSETMAGQREQLQNPPVLDDWDRHHGVGESVPEKKDDEDEDDSVVVPESFSSRRPSGSAVSDVATVGETDPNNERPRLTSDSSLKSRRRSSNSIHRMQEHMTAARGMNHSTSATVGLGLEMASSSGGTASNKDLPPRPESYSVQQQQQQQQQIRRQSSNDLRKDERDDDGTLADDDIAMVPGSRGRGERRRRAKGPGTPTEEQAVPQRRVSYGWRESVEKDEMEDQAREGDDERSPLSTRKPQS
ncbi:hypothetical protein BGZ96_010648 [Linnemannia gamsii]|uniref:SUN domain-containing protein n=1 Tax=Linnemannia gamsii TaxID=64522 RepID=A0ABQ7JTU8_9FUNG|nr:hypothetical protein BGZ96_010648 [Linnemannia gamsii]